MRLSISDVYQKPGFIKKPEVHILYIFSKYIPIFFFKQIIDMIDNGFDSLGCDVVPIG